MELGFFFGKDPSRVEVINDINSELINFYEVVRLCPRELVLELQWDLVSRDLFELYKGRKKPQSNIERAKNFFYVLKGSFGGQANHFGYSPSAPSKLNLEKTDKIIYAAHNRLKRVTIENLDYRQIIQKYDRPYTFFYLDPPYRTSTSKNYCSWFSDQDYIDLRDFLQGIGGKFLLSINNDGFIFDLFKDFNIEFVSTKYSVCKGSTHPVTELLISNFEKHGGVNGNSGNQDRS